MRCDKRVAMDVTFHFRKFRVTFKFQELNGHVSRKQSNEVLMTASCHLYHYTQFMTVISNPRPNGLMFQTREYLSSNKGKKTAF
jgi:hypothetical protein